MTLKGIISLNSSKRKLIFLLYLPQRPQAPYFISLRISNYALIRDYLSALITVKAHCLELLLLNIIFKSPLKYEVAKY